jgi:hypothetical protein
MGPPTEKAVPRVEPKFVKLILILLMKLKA